MASIRFGNGLEFHHDVAEELAFDGVADGALVNKAHRVCRRRAGIAAVSSKSVSSSG